METIHFRCPSCEQSLQIGADKAGRKVRCKRCQTPVVVPAPDDPGPPPDEDATATKPPREKTRRDPRSTRLPRDRTTEIEEYSPPDEERDEPDEGRPTQRKKRRPSEAWR